MKKILLIAFLFLSGLPISSVFADYYRYYDYDRYHPYHYRYYRQDYGYVYCPVCGLYHYSNHPHFRHDYYYYRPRPIVIEHGRSVVGQTVIETNEIVE